MIHIQSFSQNYRGRSLVLALRGDPANEDKIERIIKEVYCKDPSINPLSPIHRFGKWYDLCPSYEIGMEQCFLLLDQATELWIYGDWKNSKGVRMEIEYAKENNISMKFVNTYSDDEINIVTSPTS